MTIDQAFHAIRPLEDLVSRRTTDASGAAATRHKAQQRRQRLIERAIEEL